MFRCDMCGAPASASQLPHWHEYHVFRFDDDGDPKPLGTVHACPSCSLPIPGEERPDTPRATSDGQCGTHSNGVRCVHQCFHTGPHACVGPKLY